MWTGSALVLVSWAVILVSAIGVGLLPALAVHGRASLAMVRSSLWWGIALLAVLVTILSLAMPMESATAAAFVPVFVLVLSMSGLWAVRRPTQKARKFSSARNPWVWVLVIGLAGAVAYLAVAALGPVTNYDSGLYHLGAISYAADFRAIPGLANLYFPLGYSNAHFPIAAFLGNSPWDGIGYRLINGTLFASMALDLILRAFDRRRGPGFFVLSVGATAAFVPMIALSDYWVTSPTSDSAVLVLSLVSSAYLADAASSKRRALSSASIAVVVAVLTAMLRPTMVVFAGATLFVALILIWKRVKSIDRREQRHSRVVVMLCSAFTLGAALAILARDVVLSGWLQYPLSLFPVNVPWRAEDPTQFRVPTLGAARDPADLWSAAEGWGWVNRWFERLSAQWETYEMGLLSVVALILIILAARTTVPLRGRALVFVMAPSMLMVAVWWVATPPAFRFIWGPLFAVAALPAGWALWRLTRAGRPRRESGVYWLASVGLSAPVLAVVTFSALFRFDGGGLTEERTWDFGVELIYMVTPVVDAPTRVASLESGLTVLIPTESDQCWSVYPLCTPQVAGSVRLAGNGIQDGFLP